MEFRSGRLWVILLASAVVWATLVGAGVVRAADAPPISGAWSITSSGTAETSGELLFRVTGQGRPGGLRRRRAERSARRR